MTDGEMLGISVLGRFIFLYLTSLCIEWFGRKVGRHDVLMNLLSIGASLVGDLQSRRTPQHITLRLVFAISSERFWSDARGWHDRTPEKNVNSEDGFTSSGVERLRKETIMGNRRAAFTDEKAGGVTPQLANALCTRDGGWYTPRLLSTSVEARERSHEFQATTLICTLTARLAAL